MQKIYLRTTRPIFEDVVNGVSTYSFSEAHKWLLANRNVRAKYYLSVGQYSIDLTLGKNVSSDDECKLITEYEPYGTVHWNPEERSLYIHLPDSVCEFIGGIVAE